MEDPFMSVVTIIGSGMMGSALTVPLRYNAHEVRLVGTPLDRELIAGLKENGFHKTLKRRLPEGVRYEYFENAEKAIFGADVIVGGVSSFGLDWFRSTVIPMLPEDVPVISVTKGMVDMPDGTLVSYPEIYEQSTEKKISFNAIGGPSTSYELADRDPSHVTFCGRGIGTLRNLKAIFETPFYCISLSTDVRGVECAVAMKNAYALGVTLAIGLSYAREGREIEHYNSQAALFGQSVKEMTKLLELCGGGADNLYLGVGDLYVTVFGGRSRKIGTLLGTGMEFDKAMEALAGVTLESVVIAGRTAKAVKALAARGVVKTSDFPLLMHIGELINREKTVDIPWKAFENEKY
jgi:glycerol-3-phosphate dehydrogenase (NAD(P)+)